MLGELVSFPSGPRGSGRERTRRNQDDDSLAADPDGSEEEPAVPVAPGLLDEVLDVPSEATLTPHEPAMRLLATLAAARGSAAEERHLAHVLQRKPVFN